MEILDGLGLLDRLGPPPSAGPGHFGGIPLDLAAAHPSRFPGQWKAPQTLVEKVLYEWAAGLGAEVRRRHTVTGLTVAEHRVDVAVTGPDGERLRFGAAYLAGCDGEQSTVRRLGGFEFPGSAPVKELLRADISGIDIPDRRFQRHPNGVANCRRGPDGVTRLMVHQYGRAPRPGRPGPGLRRGLPGLGAGDRRGHHRRPARLGQRLPQRPQAGGELPAQPGPPRRGRRAVQLPVGGQALNLGLQDAAALGGKLAARITGRADDRMLDSYHAERHPVGARVLGNIEAQAQLLFGGPEVDALRAVFGELLALEPARRHLASMISGLDGPRPAVSDTGRTEHPTATGPFTRTHRRSTMGKLTGRTALVTGSSRGIGRATAIRLAREGALVAVHCSRDTEGADDTVAAVEKEGGRAFAVAAELGVSGDVHALFLELERGLKERTGETTLDIVVNNAGVMGGVAPEDVTPEQFDRLFAVNAKAPFFIVQRALRLLPDGGRIINISSGLTRFANPQEVAYAMTKGAIDQLTLHYAKHLGPRNITVNSVGPGITDNGTPVFDNPEAVAEMARYSVFERVGETKDIADVVAFLASDDARWITGSYLDASGGTLLR
uniref:Putative oxidase-reducatse n=1 Tax=Streptomyces sp. SCC 2136 TaxID=264024 RepID=Q2HR25_9ACTN|nr:putative oxidase-reducatse [Streptomyces sp. SCC 2136]